MALSEAQSRLALKDAALVGAQARAERERMSLKDVQACLTQAKQKSRRLKGSPPL
jgi:hypothetical protein